MSYRAEASGGKASGVEDQELMNAIGRMVLSAAALEYTVAVLVALTEGHQDQAAENRALQLVQTDGAPVRELRRIALGPPERRDLNRLCQEAEAVLEERNAVVHAIPLEDSAAGAEGSLTGWHPRTGQQIQLTTWAVLGHVQDLHIARRRFDNAITAATSQTSTKPVIRQTAVLGGPPWGPAPKPVGAR